MFSHRPDFILLGKTDKIGQEERRMANATDPGLDSRVSLRNWSRGPVSAILETWADFR